MRCLALGQAHADARGTVVFATDGEAPALDQRLREEGFSVWRIAAPRGSPEDAGETAAAAKRAGASFVVVDGYHFGPLYHARVRESGVPLAVFDDGLDEREHCA